MFDELFQALTRGKRIEAYGHEFIVVHAIGNNLYLAIRADDAMPAQIFLIEDKLEKEKGELEKLFNLPADPKKT